MKLSQVERLAFERECVRGRLFFWRGHGVASAINRFYQRRMAPGAGPHFDHVGVIGDKQGAYESTFFAGPSRNRSVRRYLEERGKLVIAEVAFEGEPLAPAEVENGMAALIRRIQEINDRRGLNLSYNWLTLATLGQMSFPGRMICSELARLYLDEAMRGRPRWVLNHVGKVLPDELVQFGRVVWEGGK